MPKAAGRRVSRASRTTATPGRAEPVETRTDVCQRMMKAVNLASLPRPPQSGPEWRERAAAICRIVPSLHAHLPDAPVGWLALFEWAAQEIFRLLQPGRTLVTMQVKEKFGTLRWYAQVQERDGAVSYDDPVYGVVEWAEAASAQICAAFGTADGEQDGTGGWWLTLSPDARRLRRESGNALSALLYPDWVHD